MEKKCMGCQWADMVCVDCYPVYPLGYAKVVYDEITDPEPEFDAAFKEANRQEPDSFDKIDNPQHYNHGKIQTWDWIELGLTDDEFKGYLKGNMFKYSQRYAMKGGVEDLDKLEAYKKRLASFESGKRVYWYYGERDNAEGTTGTD